MWPEGQELRPFIGFDLALRGNQRKLTTFMQKRQLAELERDSRFLFILLSARDAFAKLARVRAIESFLHGFG